MKINLTLAILILFLVGFSTLSNAQIGFGGSLTQSIDLLQTPVKNSNRVYNVIGSAFTVQPAIYAAIADELSIELATGASLAFMSNNNSSGEIDRDIMYTIPILLKVNFGSAANTGNDCTLWGWYVGAGRQWRSAINIHGTTTTSFVTYFGEIGGTINATAPMAIGVFSRLGFGTGSTRIFQLGLSFSYNHKENGCK